MQNHRYQRTVEDLRELASMFWPEELSLEAAKLSIIPTLLQTQDKFISILSVDVNEAEDVFGVLERQKLPANLFLKHLMLLADVGGEPLKRINGQFKRVFPNGKLVYMWGEKERIYEFQALPLRGFGNEKLYVDGRSLFEHKPLTPLMQDVAMVLMLGNATIKEGDEEIIDILSRCEISDYIGKKDALEQFIKQRYIWVSNITRGTQANNLGQITQNFVKDYIEDNCKVEGLNVKSNGKIPGITHTVKGDERLTTFDLVISKGNQYLAVEVSFQVTTNSTIERKSGQAQSRFEQIESKGYKIAYVIDGAGNFERYSALRTICDYSHCTVALSRTELDVLCQFIREYFGQPNQP